MPFHLIENDITEMKCDAIVNAANEYLMQGGGVCGAIFRKAGSEDMQKECDAYGHCDSGCAVITSGYALHAKYVIHGVGPVYRGGNCNERELLFQTYTHSLELADHHNCASIAFPLISSGIYGYPKKEALEVAKEACVQFLKEHEMEIYLVFYNRFDFVSDEHLLKEIQDYLNNNLSDSQIAENSNLSFDYILKERKETFSEMLIRMIDEKGYGESNIYHRANVDRKHFSKIRNTKDYSPKKNTVFAFAIALELNMEETEELLKTAGYSFSDSIKEDLILKYFIEHKMYDLYKINEVLFYYHLNTLD